MESLDFNGNFFFSIPTFCRSVHLFLKRQNQAAIPRPYPNETNFLLLQPVDPEFELIQRCLRGDASAQFGLYDRYVSAMYNTALRIVVQASEAEDVLQESFTKVFQRLHSFRRESTLGAWIKRIVVNTALNHLRDQKKFQFVPLEPWVEQTPDTGEIPETWDAALLQEAIKRLPDGCRVVFTLFLVENMSHKDIALDLGISESTSKTQYMRAKKLLREQLLHLPKAAI